MQKGRTASAFRDLEGLRQPRREPEECRMLNAEC